MTQISLPVVFGVFLLIGALILSFGGVQWVEALGSYIITDVFKLYQTSALTEAIKCAYYRCYKGCTYAINAADPNYFDCAPFCDPTWTDTKTLEGKICGKNPVPGVDTTIKVFAEKNVELNHKFDDFSNMFISSTCEKTGTRYLLHTKQEAQISVDINKIVPAKCAYTSIDILPYHLKLVKSTCGVRKS
jgi:hypothetical protein